MSDAIIAKILEDARFSADAILEEGGNSATAIIAEANAEAAVLMQKSTEEISELKDEIVRRRITVANLEVRKLLLAAKKKALDSIFSEAAKEIINLPKDKYLAIISGMLKMAENGDSVKIAPKDKDIITEKFIIDYALANGVKITLSSEYADIAGGIILCSGEVEKNLSLEVELAALRERLEPETAAKLFA